LQIMMASRALALLATPAGFQVVVVLLGFGQHFVSLPANSDTAE
jgi:hypothetical protein